MIDWKALILNLSAGNVIPIIGNDLSLLKGENGTPVPLYEVIKNRVVEIKELKDSKQSIGEIVLESPKIASTIKSVYEQIDEENFYSGPLEKLAEIKDFKFFVSTSFDDLLERAIQKVRQCSKNELKVINYFPYGNSPVTDDSKVTVFNVLGNLGDLKHSAIDEEEILEYFFTIMSRENEEHPQVTYFLRQVSDKSLLFIGCDFPDWLMRFVIRILTNRRIKDGKCEDYIVNDLNKEHVKLKNFLVRCQKDFVVIDEGKPRNAEAFVDLLYRKWTDKIKSDKRTRYEGSVFLSYYCEDQKDAGTLKNALETERIDVWFDKDDLHAGEHEDRIWEAIDKCKIFTPIISEKCLDADESYAKDQEWPKANLIYNYKKKSDQPLIIIPCFVGEIDLKDRRIPEFIRKSTIFDLKTKQGKIIDEIKNFLKPKR